ncbi:MAG: entericidin A/B family lipoprotein [Gallionella sp.]
MKAAVSLALAVFFLAGCNTMEGLGKDIQKGGTALEKAAEKDKAAEKQ